MILLPYIPLLRDLCHIEAELSAYMCHRVIVVCNTRTELLPQLWEVQRHRPVHRRMSLGIGHVVRERAERKRILVRILALADQFFDEVAAAYVMHHVAEFLAA